MPARSPALHRGSCFSNLSPFSLGCENVVCLKLSGVLRYCATPVSVYRSYSVGQLASSELNRMVPRPNSVRVLSRITFVVLVVSGCLHAQTSRWTEERAKTWYGQQAWLVGSNYIPDDAI